MSRVLALGFLATLVFSQPPFKWENCWKELIIEDWENVDHAKAFEGWKAEFGKSYKDLEEEAYRFGIFLENWEKINKHNMAGTYSYTMRLNQFGDLSSEEFPVYVHGHKGSCLRQRTAYERAAIQEVSKTVKDVPDSIDWTNYNGKSYVTPVKNQGSCGSCWAFSTTGSIESRSAIAGKDLVSLSEQQLVDCSGSYGNEGCNGGLMDNAFKYVESEGGLCSESEYPYKGTDGTCKASSCTTLYDSISSYVDVKHDNSDDLKAAVAEGPVSVAIEADQYAFQFYSGGVLDGTCGTRLDHGVLVVGYGTESGQEYWKVKNSWGSSWGEDGYVLICRECNKNGDKGECGILEEPSYPVSKA